MNAKEAANKCLWRTQSIAYCTALIRVKNGTMNYAKKMFLQEGLPCRLMQHRWKDPLLIIVLTILGSFLRNKHSEVEVNGLQQ